MPKVTVAHRPELTKEQTMEIFAKEFAGQYRVAPFRGLFRDFVIEKNAFTGVAVKLEQSSTQTKLIYNAFTSRWWARVLGGMLIGPILGRGLTAEVRQFIDTSPELQGSPVTAEQPAMATTQ
ncbi:MAG: hypothetical protein WD557_04435 [Dehalococcoidia bacterium]